MGLRRHLQTNQVLASCPIPTALGSVYPSPTLCSPLPSRQPQIHGLQPCEDEGRKLICVLKPCYFSQSNYLHLSISLQIRAHSATAWLLPTPLPTCLPTVSAALHLQGSKNHRESLMPRHQIIAPPSKPPSHNIDIQGMG